MVNTKKERYPLFTYVIRIPDVPDGVLKENKFFVFIGDIDTDSLFSREALNLDTFSAKGDCQVWGYTLYEADAGCILGDEPVECHHWTFRNGGKEVTFYAQRGEFYL